MRSADPKFRETLKTKVHARVLETLDLVQAQRMPIQELRDECLRKIDGLLSEERVPLANSDKQQLLLEVMDEIFGLGPLEEIMRDPAITDILINGAKQIYVERQGRLELYEASFRDEKHLLQVIQRIAADVGRRIDESSPMLDARLSDGSRVNAIIPPLSLTGACMSIRRFAGVTIDSDRLIEFGAWTKDMARFMEAAVRCKANTIVSGGTGSGKTTLLNVLSKWIPLDERVITIEDAAELKLQREHVVSLETRPPNIEGAGGITQRDLLRNTLRMRPDRIIIGEVRGGEALDMLQAMNTGHEGSMSTVHANSARDGLRRIESMVTMGEGNFPMHVIRETMASTLNLVIQLSRLTGGQRKVLSIAEITGIEGEIVLLQDIFRFRQTGLDGNGHATGYFESTGVRPKLLDRFEAEGVKLPPEMFRRTTGLTSEKTARM
jgi:pilus assembly protein CpaF